MFISAPFWYWDLVNALSSFLCSRFGHRRVTGAGKHAYCSRCFNQLDLK